MAIEQTWDANRYAEHAQFVSELGLPVVDLLAPQPGERILDLGCGDGALTAQLEALGCQVIGVDASPVFVEAARNRGVQAQLIDGHRLPFENEFDAVFSNAALHWMTAPDQVIDGVYRALKLGGRFVGEFGGQGNVATIQEALHQALAKRGFEAESLDPWYFPTVIDYEERLQRGGFTVEQIALIPRPTPLPTDICGWLTTFAQTFSSALPRSEQAVFLDEVVQRLKPKLCDPDGRWVADYVRLRFAARKSP